MSQGLLQLQLLLIPPICHHSCQAIPCYTCIVRIFLIHSWASCLVTCFKAHLQYSSEALLSRTTPSARPLQPRDHPRSHLSPLYCKGLCLPLPRDYVLVVPLPGWVALDESCHLTYLSFSTYKTDNPLSSRRFRFVKSPNSARLSRHLGQCWFMNSSSSK